MTGPILFVVTFAALLAWGMFERDMASNAARKSATSSGSSPIRAFGVAMQQAAEAFAELGRAMAKELER